MHKFEIGDTVYWPQSVWSEDKITCPVCNGNGRVLIKPENVPDNEGNLHVCNYCNRFGYDGSGKVADQWSWHPKVNSFKVEGFEEKNIAGKVTRKLLFNVSGGGHSSFDETNESLFFLYSEAYNKAVKDSIEANNRSRIEKLGVRKSEAYNVSWFVGYSKAQLRDEKKRIKELKVSIEDLQCELDNCERRVEYATRQLCLK